MNIDEEIKKRRKKPRMLIATDNFLPRFDGIARFLSEIVPKLLDTYEVTVVAPDFGKYEPEGFRLVQVPLSKRGLGDYKLAKYEPGIIKNLINKSDIVFSQTIGPIGGTAVRFAKKKKIPVASFMHSIEWELVPMATDNVLLRRILYPMMKAYARYIYNKSNLLIIPSEGISEIISWQRIKTRKDIVHLGVDCQIFKPFKDRIEKNQRKIVLLREELGLSDKIVIGNHGRIAEEKDLYTLARAFNWLQKKHPQARLLLIGDGVVKIKEKLSSVNGVILVGAKKDVNHYLNLVDIYVTSSLTETTSLSTLEAMASSLPVISTPVGFIKDYVDDNVNGFLFATKDAYALFKRMELLVKNPQLAKTFGERARKKVEKEFTWNHTVEGIKEALRTLER